MVNGNASHALGVFQGGDDVVDELLHIDHMPLAHAQRWRETDSYYIRDLLIMHSINDTNNSANLRATDIETRKDAFLGHREKGKGSKGTRLGEQSLAGEFGEKSKE
jgi:hypothetical protein